MKYNVQKHVSITIHTIWLEGDIHKYDDSHKIY